MFDLVTIQCSVDKALSDINLFSWQELHTCSLYSSVSSNFEESCGGYHVLWMHGKHCHHISQPSMLPRGCHLYTVDMVVPWVASCRTLQEQICKLFIKSVSFYVVYISNITLHNDLRIPYVTEVIRTYVKNHKNRTAQNNNQLIRDLVNQPEIGRRLNRMDLVR
jgi:hypothetical protein